MSEFLGLLLELNVAAGAATALVLCLRKPFRLRFGAQAAYALWWTPAFAALAVLIPRNARALSDQGDGLLANDAGAAALAALWLAGVAVAVVVLAASHLCFERRARKGRAGPALVGVLTPRLVMPSDSRLRWTPAELALIRAHERVHLDRNHPRINGLVTVVQCLCWFNPLVHLGAARLRFDQELACDAEVMSSHPRQRRCYLQAMIKAQGIAAAPPLSCGWGVRPNSLEERVAALCVARRSSSGAELSRLALSVVVALTVWAIQPADSYVPEVDDQPLGGQRVIYIDVNPPAEPVRQGA